MRHLGSLLAGLIAAPVIWLLLAIGQPQTTSVITRWIERDGFKTINLVGPVAYLVAAGLVLGLVASLRISPAGAVAAGIGYGALYGALFVTPLTVIDAIPNRLDLGIVVARPRVPVVNGTLVLLAICLLVAMASRSRWRRWPGTAAAASTAASTGPGESPVTAGPAEAPAFAAGPAEAPIFAAGPAEAPIFAAGPAEAPIYLPARRPDPGFPPTDEPDTEVLVTPEAETRSLPADEPDTEVLTAQPASAGAPPRWPTPADAGPTPKPTGSAPRTGPGTGNSGVGQF